MDTSTVLPDAVTSASCPRERYDPVNSFVRTPVTPCGSRICALASPRGTSHSSPVTFQYNSS